LNHGLSVRDSLLTSYDSNWAAMRAATPLGAPAHVRRLLATSDEAVRRFPEDPEVWYEVYGTRQLAGVARNERELLETLDRLIAEDSTFLMAYHQAIVHALNLDGPARALVYLTALRHAKADQPSSYDMRMTEAALRGDGPLFERLIDSASADELTQVAWSLNGWPDSANLTGQLLRLGRRDRNGQFLYNDSTTAANVSRFRLLFRGHVGKACTDLAILPRNVHPSVLTWCGVLHGLPADSVQRMLRGGWDAAQQEGDAQRAWGEVYGGLLWWADQRDTLMLERIESWMSASARREPSLSGRVPSEYYLASARAYRDLARGDSAHALARFKTLPDSLCPSCWTERLTRARLQLGLGLPRDALKTMDYWVPDVLGTSGGTARRVVWVLTRGEAAEQVGERDLAVKSYGFVVDAWQHGDSGVQPYVQQARAGLARLTAEPRR
jgi:serine/threonine-protein kinase